MKGSLLFALGIALLSLGLVSINTYVSSTHILSQRLTIDVPPTASGEIQLVENSTNVTAYVEVVHNGVAEVVKLDSLLPLSPGEWSIVPYEELYTMNVTKVVNVTESLSCGNVTVEKVIHEVKTETSRNATYPIYVKISVDKMELADNPGLLEAIGTALSIMGLAFMALEKLRGS